MEIEFEAKVYYHFEEDDDVVTCEIEHIYLTQKFKGITKQLFPDRELSKELADRADFITNMAQKSVRERLAFTMLILMDVFDNQPINLSREDLANFVGTATETLIRLLKDFKEEGIIEVRTRKIFVLDRQRLLKVAGK